ncbi:hypothetical protein D9M68_979000 [compost metagenome]
MISIQPTDAAGVIGSATAIGFLRLDYLLIHENLGQQRRHLLGFTLQLGNSFMIQREARHRR